MPDFSAAFSRFIEENESKGSANPYRRKGDRRIIENLRRKFDEGALKDVCDIDGYVLGDRGDKGRVSEIVNDFYAFCRDSGIDEDASEETILNNVEFIDIPVLRQLEITRLLHEPKRVSDLMGILGRTRTVINSDLRALRDGIRIFGSEIRIEEEKVPGNPRSRRYRSTVHPVFLPLNLTEVYLLLKGLDELSESRRDMGSVYRDLGGRIYGQLSGYAKERMRAAFKGSLPFPKTANSYRNEEDYVTGQRKTTAYVVGYALKAGCTCRIVFKYGGDDREVTGTVRNDPKGRAFEDLIVTDVTDRADGVYRIKEDRIISCIILEYK